MPGTIGLPSPDDKIGAMGDSFNVVQRVNSASVGGFRSHYVAVVMKHVSELANLQIPAVSRQKSSAEVRLPEGDIYERAIWFAENPGDAVKIRYLRSTSKSNED